MGAGAMGALTAAAAGARILSVLIGEAQAAGDFARAESLMKQALEQYGTADPNALANIDVEAESTELDKHVEDPEAREAQLLALRRMGEMATGDSPEDDAAFARSEQESGRFERGIREAAMRRMQERGISGSSGLAVAAQMNAAQMGTQQKANADLQTAAESRRRALAALGQYGQMAGSIRGQNYGMARDRAAAQDAINRFNAGQRFDQAQGTFNNNMDKANSMQGAFGNLSDYYGARGRKTVKQWSAGGDMVSDVIDSFNPASALKKDDE